MKKIYRILNKNLVITENNLFELPSLFHNFFVASNGCVDDASLEIELVDMDEACYGIESIGSTGTLFYGVFFSQRDYSHVLCALDNQYTKFQLFNRGKRSEEAITELIMSAFYSYVSLQDTLLMHASAIVHKESGIVFTAASGVGKTTQAELWAKYRSAMILNGDKVFLKQEKDEIYAWGSPWNGSSCYAENKGVPLKAIVVLKQAKKNKIRRLEGLEILENVVPHIFFPKWDRKCEQAVLTFLDFMLQKTEVYLLECCPEKEAVDLLETEIFRDGL